MVVGREEHRPTTTDSTGEIMSSFRLDTIHRADGACILSVEGAIDDSCLEAFEQGLAAGVDDSLRLVVDLSSCTMSAGGLQVIKRLQQSDDHGTPVRLVAREPCLLRMLDEVGLAAAFETYPPVDEALSSALLRGLAPAQPQRAR